MKHNWEYKPFKQLSDILYGCPFESEFFNSESLGMPLIRIRDVKPGFTSTYFNGAYSDEYLIKKGEYLIGMDGEFNIAPWQSKDALLNQRVCRVKSLNENIILSGFIYYFLGKELKNIEAQTSFVTVKHLSAKVLNAINTPVPPMKTQEQIVAELDQINDLIAKNRELLSQLDALAQSLFYDTFGDPISNPKGWNTKEFANVIKLKSGDSLSAKNIVAGIYPVYGGNGIVGYHNKTNLKGENIIIGRVGALCGNVRLVKGEIFVTDNAFITECKEKFNPLFLQRLLDVLNLRQYANAAAQPVISNTSLKKIIVPVPPLALQEDFAAKVEAIEAQKAKVEAEIAELQTLLDARMDYWFN